MDSAAGQPPAAPQDGTFATLDTNIYEPLLGCTIGEVGGVASGMHMCQGRVPMVAPPGASFARYRLFDTVLPKAQQSAETSLFDGIDVSLGGLARFAGERPPQALVTALGNITSRVDAASRALESRGPGGNGAGPGRGVDRRAGALRSDRHRWDWPTTRSMRSICGCA